MSRFICPVYDSTFKHLWKNKECRKWFVRLLELITRVNLEEYHLYDSEINSGNNKKDFKLDILFIKGDNVEDCDVFNIELYKKYYYYNEIKSNTYIFNIMSSNLNSGGKYKKRYGIQVNFHDYLCHKDKNLSITQCMLRDPINEVEKDDVTIYDVYLPKFAGICYTDDDELGAMLSLLHCNSYYEMMKVASNNKEALSIVEELERLSVDENFLGVYDAEVAHRKEVNSARSEGIEIGIDIGKEEKRLEDAQSLIKNGASLELISKSLGYSIEELEKIRDELDK